jgi:hypothetical protein
MIIPCKKKERGIYFLFRMAAPAPSNTARNTGAGGSDAFVVGREVAGAAVGGVVSGGKMGVYVGVGEEMSSAGTGSEECISGLSVYDVPLPIDTREVVDFFK